MSAKAIEELEAVAAMAERGQLTNEEVEHVGAALRGEGDEAQGSDTTPGQDSATEADDERMARRFRELRFAKKAAAAAREAAKATSTDEERRELEIREAAEAVVAEEKGSTQKVVIAEAVREARAQAEAAGQTLTPREIAIVKIKAILYGRG